MRIDTVIKELLESACPSIQYRIRSEILGQSPTSKEMVGLQNDILHDPGIQAVLRWQQTDGWLARDFHGAISTETGIRILCEKGVRGQHPAFARALQALEDHPERLERGIGKAGRILDDLGFGGPMMIRAAVFAYAGLENKPSVQEQVYEALSGFETVLHVNSLNEVVEAYRGKLVFRPGVRWPGIYHLRLLAFTRKWRTRENLELLVKAIQRLVELSPIPDIYVRSQSQWIAPASFCMHDFNPDMQSMDDMHWMMAFHRIECLARLGTIPAIPVLRQQVDGLESLLDAGDGWFTRKLNHPYFTRWGSYTGLRLEPDWRQAKSRKYDLTFRSMLILHYCAGIELCQGFSTRIPYGYDENKSH
jgi:hypothetical protein